MTEFTRTDLRIPTSSGEHIDAWLYEPTGLAPFPVVVMGHGIGGIKAIGLTPFAEHFARNGFAAVVFDYRHWGRSDGNPRELLSIQAQRDDYRSVLSWASAHENLDRNRLFIWGTSFAGMHIAELAATDTRIVGAIAQCPLVDGTAGLTRISPLRAIRLTAHAIVDTIGSRMGASPRYVPLSVAPGEYGVIATADALTGLHLFTIPDGESWPNRITARSLLEIARYRPARKAGRIPCPVLMVVAEADTMAPTRPATQLAARAPRGELYRSRGGHYDVYLGGAGHTDVLRVELEFLNRHASAADERLRLTERPTSSGEASSDPSSTEIAIPASATPL